MSNNIEQYRNKLDEQYQISKVKRDHNHRHARGWVSSCVDYVLLGLPAIAPIPNLLNLSVALTPVLGFWAAAIAAVALELLLFGSAEIILYLQDKQMRRGNYETALRIAIGCGVAFVIILLSLILSYEVPRHGWAVLTLPFVSVISIAFLSLKRWADIRDDIERDQREDRLTATVANLETLQLQLEDKTDLSETLSAQLSDAMSEIDSLKSQTLHIKMSLSEALSENQKLRQNVVVSERDSAKSRKMSKKDRQTELLIVLDKITDPQDIDHDNLADIFGTSSKTIMRDIAELSRQNLLNISGEPAIHTNGVHA